MYCGKCGTKLKDDARFCPKCGAPVTNPSKQEETAVGEHDDSRAENAASFQESGGSPNKNNFPKWVPFLVIAAVIAALVIVVVIRLHSSAKEPELQFEEAVAEETLIGEEEEEIVSEEIPEEEPVDLLTQNVTITDITLTPFEVSVDEYSISTEAGYAIGMTISNENDLSCDVSPSFQITATTLNNYDEPGTADYYLMRTSYYNEIFSPYARGVIGLEAPQIADASYLFPVGLAPHETKTVYYYVNAADVIDENGEEVSIDFDINNSIDAVKLLDYAVAETSCIYIASEEWGETLQYGTERFGYFGDDYMVDFWGTITNNTIDKWESMHASFDFRVNGQNTIVNSAIDKAVQNFEYVNTGETVEYSDRAGDVRGEDEIEVLPALLWYYPDYNEA